MDFPAAVEQWRPLVNDVAPDLPADLILGLIDRESIGDVGAVSRLTVAKGFTPFEMACGLNPNLNFHALGLMQVTPIALRDYNQRNPHDPITPCQLAGTTRAAARAQIKAGVSVYKQALRFAHNVNAQRNPWPDGPISKEQILLSDLVYTRGAGAVKKKLADCKAAGLPLTYRSIKSLSKNWGFPETPFKHAESVLAFYSPESENGKKKAILSS